MKKKSHFPCMFFCESKLFTCLLGYMIFSDKNSFFFLTKKDTFGSTIKISFFGHEMLLFWSLFFRALSFSHSVFFFISPDFLCYCNLNFSVCRARFADSFDIIVHGRFEKMTYINIHHGHMVT